MRKAGIAAGLVLGLTFGAGFRSVGAQAPRFDLLIKGGRVVDPKNGIDRVMDIAIAGGRIARVAPDIVAVDARRVLVVRDHYVTPGLIDLHAHHYGYSGAIYPTMRSSLPWSLPRSTAAVQVGAHSRT